MTAADLQKEMIKLGTESYNRGMRDGVEITFEGIEKLADVGMIVFPKELLERCKMVALASTEMKTSVEKSIV